MPSVVSNISVDLSRLAVGVLLFTRNGKSPYVLSEYNEKAKEYLGYGRETEALLVSLIQEPLPSSMTIFPQGEGGLSLQATAYAQEKDRAVVVLLSLLGTPEPLHDLDFLLDADFNVKDVHGRAPAESLRLSPKEVLGRPFTDFFPQETARKLLDMLERSRFTGSKQSTFYQSPVAGNRRYMQATSQWKEQDGTGAYFVHVDNLASVLDEDQGLVIIDSQNHILYADTVSQTLFGLEEQALLDRDFRTLFSTQQQQDAFTVQYRKPNQELVTLSISSTVSDQAHLLLRVSVQKNQTPASVLIHLLLDLTYQLLQTPLEEVESVLQRILQQLGEFSNSDRVSIFQYDASCNAISNTYAWNAPGCIPGQGNLQNSSCAAYSQWVKTLSSGQEIYCVQVQNLPDSWKAERELLLSRQITSILVEPIMQGSVLVGFVGFDSIHQTKDWPKEVRELLHFFAAMLGSFFTRVDEGRELQHALEETRKLASQREETNHYLHSFYAKTSHDMRDSLYSIGGMCKLLASSPLDEQQRSYVSLMHSNSLFVLNLIDDLLRHTSGTTGTFTIKKEPISLEEVLSLAVETVRVFAVEKNLTLALEYEQCIPALLAGDSVGLSRILINLLHNAVKHTDAGGVQVGAVLVGLTSDTAVVQLTVCDTGKGMDEQMLQHLDFPQDKLPLPTADGGFGLGLGIVHQLLDAMQGTLQIESRVGTGSRFVCTIPFALEQPVSVVQIKKEVCCTLGLPEQRCGLSSVVGSDLIPAQCAALLVGESFLGETANRMAIGTALTLRQGKTLCYLCGSEFSRTILQQAEAYFPVAGYLLYGQSEAQWASELQVKLHLDADQLCAKRVLVVDDSPINIEILRRRISALQVSVETATGGDQALQMLSASLFDLVFMDLNMYGLDGIETIAHMRAQGYTVPVVVLSAAYSPEQEAACRKLGVERFLLKPVEQRKLEEILNRL